MENNDKKSNRRDFLYVSTAAVGAVTAGAAIWPLVNQMNQAMDIDCLIQQTNNKDYLRLQQEKNEVLYLNCEVMQKGPKKISLYL